MRRYVITTAALLAFATAGNSRAAGSAHWTAEPLCAATGMTLTCTGKAAGVQPQVVAGLGPVGAGVTGEIRYTCSDPVFDSVFSGFPADAPGIGYFGEVDFHNGHSFSVGFSPPNEPSDLGARILCTSGEWTRDREYYHVRVAVGWGFGSYSPIEGLSSSIGTVPLVSP
jgi:hypothetical protein